MSIPLDRLYHYIERVAKDVHGDNIVIYRFYPHGSKNLADLDALHFDFPVEDYTRCPTMYCYDQEPLDFARYESWDPDLPLTDIEQELTNCGVRLSDANIRRKGFNNIWDQCLLLHSECNSWNVDQYRRNGFVPVYFWSHALIALDWFRYAEHVRLARAPKKRFLVYNRAWSGTREYRLKFADYLIALELDQDCLMSCNPIEPELNIHYDLHEFKNPDWRPVNPIEKYFPLSTATSNYSADFDIKDYESTDIEVVLETLFDDNRVQLTEKILRPIALGQPFILVSTPGSLEYLRSYGFKTFGHLWDEQYDLETNPRYRLHAVVDLMKQITTWLPHQYESKMAQARAIAEYNRQHFFSDKFQQKIKNELRDNINLAVNELMDTNSGKRYQQFQEVLAAKY